jgi:tRNA-dihydrouridine synthase B
MLDHLDALYRFYGEARGVRTARKHLGWYLAGRPGGERLRQRIVKVESAPEQLALVGRYFEDALYNGLAA